MAKKKPPAPGFAPDDNPDVPEGMKRCSRCLSILLFRDFDKDATKPDGHRYNCKRCRATTKAELERKEIADKAAELDRRAVDIISKVAGTGAASIPHVAELFHHLVDVFGGPEMLAQHCMGTYLVSKPGSPARQKILSMIMQMAVKVTDSGAASMPLDLMTDEDIENELNKRMERQVEEKIKLRIADAEEKTA